MQQTKSSCRKLFVRVAVPLFGVFFATLVGCFGGKSESDSIVDVSSPAVDQTVSEALDELRRLTALNGSKNTTICFLGVRGSAPHTSAAGLSAATRRRLESGSSRRVLEKSVVDVALKESGVRANNLFIPAERKKFVEALGEPIDFLLVGTIVDGKKSGDDSDDDSGGESGSDAPRRTTGPTFKLELIELSTNKTFEYVADLNR